jgi:hypothetical protein
LEESKGFTHGFEVLADSNMFEIKRMISKGKTPVFTSTEA